MSVPPSFFSFLIVYSSFLPTFHSDDDNDGWHQKEKGKSWRPREKSWLICGPEWDAKSIVYKALSFLSSFLFPLVWEGPGGVDEWWNPFTWGYWYAMHFLSSLYSEREREREHQEFSRLYLYPVGRNEIKCRLSLPAWTRRFEKIVRLFRLRIYRKDGIYTEGQMNIFLPFFVFFK